MLWRVLRTLTGPVPYTFVSINRRNNEARAHTAMWASASIFRRFTDTNAYGTGTLKYAKLAKKYPWIYRHLYSVLSVTHNERHRAKSAQCSNSLIFFSPVNKKHR